MIVLNDITDNNNSISHMNEECIKNNCIKYIEDNQILGCNCGEEYYNRNNYGWYWFNDNNQETNNTVITNNNRDVLFHPVYSSGTAALRGNQPFEQNQHYYWEIKMTTKLYGTDVMVGVGTRRVGLSDRTFRFCSMLGMDTNSWGYSYHGKVQHNHSVRSYGPKFNFGSLVGVHLDTCNGTIEFYLNRKPLGIAFSGLKGKELYPMVCSTAARSAMRITCAIQFESTLQMKCLQLIVNNPNLYNEYCNIIGLKRIYDMKYFWIQPKYIHNDKVNKRRIRKNDDVTIDDDEMGDNFANEEANEDFLLNCIKKFRKTAHFRNGNEVGGDSSEDE